MYTDYVLAMSTINSLFLFGLTVILFGAGL
jgi:hypothetical protein